MTAAATYTGQRQPRLAAYNDGTGSMRCCDRDGVAAAQFTVWTRAGELLFCGHHMAEHKDAVAKARYPVTAAGEPGPGEPAPAAAEETPADD